VRVVHPFHPWSGQDFEFVQRRRAWDGERVFVRLPGAEVASLPASWTDAVPPDPSVVVAAGRAAFRTADLLSAAELVARIAGASGPDATGPVREILS
jgi:hypothetical protein